MAVSRAGYSFDFPEIDTIFPAHSRHTSQVFGLISREIKTRSSFCSTARLIDPSLNEFLAAVIATI